MHRYDGQRRHIISSLDSLLYQLHILSFLLSPSIWILIARLCSQFHFARPREIDGNRTLRFWYFLVIFFNLGAVWGHAKEGASQGRSIVLDFVGMVDVPSKLHLLSLDFLIIFLEMLLATIAYETSYAAAMHSDYVDPLLPLPTIPTEPQPSTSRAPSKSTELELSETIFIIDVRLRMVMDRIRNPPSPPPPRDTSLEDLLPLPNTTSLRLSTGLQMFLRARRELTERARTAERNAERTRRAQDTTRTQQDERSEERQAVPGGMDIEDG
ncbi:hypothetical protein WOLCODRAFT_122400 [Wolfiporia cocos MD-104 SS10]|uniref:DUF1746 domain-containing protein n=1 Tax=Wolfiporia cocos (strain MD-104) TaxID=742152 RepID=A0A2H3JNB9_WOLCO|nr:hypothetical protein WOLCODRAFT_122400 [Wolfiporia cocos MD-104 SS10]